MTGGTLSLRAIAGRATLAVALLAILIIGACVQVSIARAAPPIENEPEVKLTAGAQAGDGDRFGIGVALSADGHTALVGAPHAAGLAGSASVFSRSPEGWGQQGPALAGPLGSELMACSSAEPSEDEEEPFPEETGECRFGRSVALSSDGNTALVGAPLVNGRDGGAWVYVRAGDVWTKGAQLLDPNGETANYFGGSVALSGDGLTAVVGAPGDHTSRGAAWVFTFNGTAWQPAGELAGAGEEGQGRFGASVAISADGQTILAGAPRSGGEHGAAWLFRHSGSSWVPQGSALLSGVADAARFGSSTALSADGSTALIGARRSGEDAGAASVFAQGVGGWSEQAAITGPGQPEEEFGLAVALSPDGSTALVSAPGYAENHGAAWLFRRSGSTWGEAQEQFQSTYSTKLIGPRFGSSLALSASGETILVGGQRDAHAGAAWVFGPGPVVESTSPEKGPAAGGTEVTISGNNLTGATAVHFGAAAASSFTVLSKNSITAVTPPGQGSVAVTVTTPFGTSAVNALFKYVATKGSQGPPPQEAPSSDGGGSTTTAGATVTTSLGSVLGFLSASGCNVSLLSRRVTVLAHGRVVFRLRARGAGRCAGKLRLNLTRRIARHKLRVKTIGAATFSLAAGSTATVKLKLNATGRMALQAHRGRLAASLLLVRQSPRPFAAQSAGVRLFRARTRKTAHN